MHKKPLPPLARLSALAASSAGIAFSGALLFPSLSEAAPAAPAAESHKPTAPVGGGKATNEFGRTNNSGSTESPVTSKRAQSPASSSGGGIVPSGGAEGPAVGKSPESSATSKSAESPAATAQSTNTSTNTSGLPKHWTAEGAGLPNGGNFTETLPNGDVVVGKQTPNQLIGVDDTTSETVSIDNAKTEQVTVIEKSVETNPNQPNAQPLYETQITKDNDATGAQTDITRLTTVNAPNSSGVTTGSTTIEKSSWPQGANGSTVEGQTDEDETDNWSKSTSTKTLSNGATVTDTTRTNDYVANTGGPAVTVSNPSGVPIGTDITTKNISIDNAKTDETTTIDKTEQTNPDATQSDTTKIDKTNSVTGANSQTDITSKVTAPGFLGITTGSTTIDKTSDPTNNPATEKTDEDVTVGWVDVLGVKVPTSITNDDN